MKEDKKKVEIVQVNNSFLKNQFGTIDIQGSVETNKLIQLKDGKSEFIEDDDIRAKITLEFE